MNRSKIALTSVLILALAGTGAVVSAQTTPAAPAGPATEASDSRGNEIRAQHRGGDRGQKGHRGHRGGFGGGEMFRSIFDAVDADSDRTVTQEEIDAFRAARLAEVDASGDGALSIEEFDTLYREFTRSRMVDTFQRLDADGDGVISAEEMDTRISRLIERMDRDGDGALTLQRPGARSDDG